MDSRRPVLTALLANLLGAFVKIALAIFSGSTALFAEAVHSVSDTVNQLFLLGGLQLSTRPASEKHPFGRGKEQFLWSFVAAVSVFGVSAILSVWEGVNRLLSPSVPRHSEVSIVSLLIVGAIESFALYVTYSNISRRASRRKIRGIRQFFSSARDPILFAAFLEDVVAVAGIAVASVGIYASDITGSSVYDAAAAIAIGLMLFVYGAELAMESRDLLIGEGLSRQDAQRLRALVERMPEVIRVLDLRGVYFGPDRIVLGIDVHFKPYLDTQEIQAATDRIEKALKAEMREIQYIYVEAENPPAEQRVPTG
ncbi:MAG: cation diffusion facilitator family transporter [Nitrososphaerota archaeon]|nr:cation diffusion facilitator family transporter [Nitrososphaerota archaeon]